MGNYVIYALVLLVALLLFLKRLQAVVKHQQAADARAAAAVARASAAIRQNQKSCARRAVGSRPQAGPARGERAGPGEGWRGRQP